MTSFLSSNITPTLNGFFDWMNAFCNQVTIGGGQLFLYSTNDKTAAARNTLQVTTGGKVLQWVDNAGVVVTLADTTNPTAAISFYAGTMTQGDTQVLIFPAPASTLVVDPAKGGASQNEFGKIAGNLIEYVGENGVGYQVNISGYFTIKGGAGITQSISFNFLNGLNSITDSFATCLDNGSQVIPFSLTGFTVCNAGDTMSFVMGSNNPITVDLSGLHINITPI